MVLLLKTLHLSTFLIENEVHFQDSYLYLLPFGEDDYICNGRMSMPEN